jgi:hypothetical protein
MRKSIFEMSDESPDSVFKSKEINENNLNGKKVLSILKDYEKTFKNTIDDIYSNLCEKISKLEKDMENQTEKLIFLENLNKNSKEYDEKLSDLINFKKKTNETLQSNNFLISKLETNLSNSFYKYDKLYLDNLLVPGTIGDFCKFKNLREYIEVNIINININKIKLNKIK